MDQADQHILELVHELHQIPHLKLPLQFDASILQTELKVIDKWTFHSHADYKNVEPAVMQQYSNGYSGVSLYEFNGAQDYVTDNYDIFEDNEPGVYLDPVTKQVQFLPTPLVDKMPYADSVIHQISDRMGRSRIMRSEPDHAVVWHSHNRGPWFNPFMQEAIIHVPIKTQKNVLHTVRDYRHSNSEQERFSKVDYEVLTQSTDNFIQNYAEGECWLFNSWHDHYYHNYGSDVRYTLLLYIRWFKNQKFINLVEKALADYKGPRLPKD